MDALVPNTELLFLDSIQQLNFSFKLYLTVFILLQQFVVRPSVTQSVTKRVKMVETIF